MKSDANCLFLIGRNFTIFYLALVPMALHAQNAMPSGGPDSFLYLKVQLEPKLKPASLKPGDVVEGQLIRSVYWRDREVLPRGGRVSLVVDRLERRRRVANDHWPWAIKAFAPRHEKYPIFRAAHVLLPDGRTLDFPIALLSITHNVVLRAGSTKKSPDHDSRKAEAPEVSLSVTSSSDTTASNAKTPPTGLTANLQAFVNAADFPADSGHHNFELPTETITVNAGTRARVVLTDAVSASGSHSGDAFQALLTEPISVGSVVVVPAGTVLEGKVVKARKPRMMSRSGSLLLSFISMKNPDGAANRLDASVEGVSLDRRSHAKVDSEGEIHGERASGAWMLINLGVTGGLAKVADDGTQLIVQAIVSAATDASTAGTSRIVAACVSGVFMLSRHGRDVVLPKFTEMEITFNRPLVLPVVQPNAVGGNDGSPAQSRTDQQKRRLSELAP